MTILCIILGLLGCVALWAMVRYEPAITAAMVERAVSLAAYEAGQE